MRNLIIFIIVITVLTIFACSNNDNPVNNGDNGNPAGNLYVLNQRDNTLYIYDTKTMNRIDSIDTRVNMPHFLQFSPDGQYFYITTLEASGHIARFNASTNSFVDSVSTAPSVQPSAIAIDNNDQYGYVCNFSTGATSTPTKIQKYDLMSMTLIDSMQAGAVTHDIQITSNGAVVLATNRYSDNVTLVYTDVDSVTFVSVDPDVDYPLGSHKYGPLGAIIDHKDSLAYIACADAKQVRVLDIKNRVVIDSVDIPGSNTSLLSGPTLLAMSPDDQYVYVTTRLDNLVAVVKTSPLELVAEIPVSTPAPFGIDVSDDGSRIYAACTNTNPLLNNGRVYIIDGTTFKKIDSIDVGKECFGLRFRP